MHISIDGKNYLNVEEYNGTFKFVLGYVNKEGAFKPSWCRFGFDTKENEKPQTYSIRTGDKKTTLAILKEAVREIAGNKDDAIKLVQYWVSEWIAEDSETPF